MQPASQERPLPGLLGVGMMFTCHRCKPLNLQFATWDEVVLHCAQAHPLDYVNGVPFWMLEQKVTAQDYYWIARQIQDKEFLKWAGQHRG
jgi:hypothetical protein